MSVELSLRDVRAGYGPVEVLHGVSLDVPAGAVTALLGPNGAGKTTLLSTVAGLLPLTGGTITWAGETLLRHTPHDRSHAGMLLIPERRGIFVGLTVQDNLEVFGGSGGYDAALAAFPVLAERLSQQAGSLSGGEQQMLAMSRALVQSPRVLLLDEISLGLAPRVTRRLFDVIADLAAGGITVVLVEQYLADALRMADIVHVLARGDVVFSGEPAELAGRALPGYVALGATGSS
jgi:branched-chain amino acid transport system ATP-binding protein